MASSIALELPRQNVTVVGAFNPAILQPGWVKRFVPAVEDEIHGLLPVQGGPTIFQAGPLYWIATDERLVVHGPIVQAARVASTIVRTLAHTPLRAAGINFLFQGKADRARCGPWRLSIAPAQPSEAFGGAPGEFSLSQVMRREDGIRLTIKIVWPSEEPDALLDLNYHREGQAPLGEERAKELSDHMDLAGEFEVEADRIRTELLNG
jgi:hypothetical protein